MNVVFPVIGGRRSERHYGDVCSHQLWKRFGADEDTWSYSG